MKISDLTSIGKLKFGHKTQKPYISLKPQYVGLLPKLNQIFLIFTDHRVRYGSIDIISKIGDNKATIKIADNDLYEELAKEEAVGIYLDTEGLNEFDNEDEYFDPIGMNVIWGDKEVGRIKHFFHNGAHDVYEILMNGTGMDTKPKIVLIPDVPSFVIETNIEGGFIKVENLDQFF